MNPTRGNSSPAYNSTEALGNSGNVRAVEPLLEAPQHARSGCLRWAAVEALVKIGAMAVAPLGAALKDEDWGVIGDDRAAAIWP